MATRHLYGEAELEYTPVDGPSGDTPVVHLLAVPLIVSPSFGFANTSRRVVWAPWNADDTEREVFTLGTRVDEITALVRFEDQPEDLHELLRAGLEDDVELVYRPYGSGAYAEEYPCKLVQAGGAGPGEVPLRPDRSRWDWREYEVQLLLRRTDGGTFRGLL